MSDHRAEPAAAAPRVDTRGVVLEDTAYDSPLAAQLIAELQQEHVVRYGGPDATAVDGAEFAPPDGVFLVAFSGGEPIGCAGLRRHDDGVVEIKRMFIRAAHRRRGHGRRLLRVLEDRARSLGDRRSPDTRCFSKDLA